LVTGVDPGTLPAMIRRSPFRLVNAGTPAHEAMNVSGHRTRSIFDRYSIRVDERTRAALRATTTYTDALRTGERTVVPLARHADQGRRS
jgi:hypothetical protein